jgi:hypothetical protein
MSACAVHEPDILVFIAFIVRIAIAIFAYKKAVAELELNRITFL